MTSRWLSQRQAGKHQLCQLSGACSLTHLAQLRRHRCVGIPEHVANAPCLKNQHTRRRHGGSDRHNGALSATQGPTGAHGATQATGAHRDTQATERWRNTEATGAHRGTQATERWRHREATGAHRDAQRHPRARRGTWKPTRPHRGTHGSTRGQRRMQGDTGALRRTRVYRVTVDRGRMTST